MAAPTLITPSNYSTLLVRSTNPRGSTPDGNVYVDPATQTIQLITLGELATVDLGSGAEANPLTIATKIQGLALQKFIADLVDTDTTLQGFSRIMDTINPRMSVLVGIVSFLNSNILASGAVDISGPGGELGDDRLKMAQTGFTEFSDGGATRERVYHGVFAPNLNSTTQGYYLLSDSLSEADRQAATPVDFAQLGGISEPIQTFQNGGADDQGKTLILCGREFGYSIEETDSQAAAVNELGPYAQPYTLENAIVQEIDALDFNDVWTTPIVPYSNLSFFRFATPQTRTGFATTGAGASGDFTDEIQLSTGTMDITQLRAWLDALMLSDADENANTGSTGPFRPKRAEPLYTIELGKLRTRAGLYVDPSKLTAAAQQDIELTNDSGGIHTIPFNSGIEITVSAVWLAAAVGNRFFRIGYKDAAGANDFDTANFITALDASSVAMAGDETDARIVGDKIVISYAYDIEDAGGNVTPGTDQDMILYIGGDGAADTKSRVVEFTISRSTLITVDGRTDAETN